MAKLVCLVKFPASLSSELAAIASFCPLAIIREALRVGHAMLALRFKSGLGSLFDFC